MNLIDFEAYYQEKSDLRKVPPSHVRIKRQPTPSKIGGGKRYEKRDFNRPELSRPQFNHSRPPPPAYSSPVLYSSVPQYGPAPIVLQPIIMNQPVNNQPYRAMTPTPVVSANNQSYRSPTPTPALPQLEPKPVIYTRPTTPPIPNFVKYQQPVLIAPSPPVSSNRSHSLNKMVVEDGHSNSKSSEKSQDEHFSTRSISNASQQSYSRRRLLDGGASQLSITRKRSDVSVSKVSSRPSRKESSDSYSSRLQSSRDWSATKYSSDEPVEEDVLLHAAADPQDQNRKLSDAKIQEYLLQKDLFSNPRDLEMKDEPEKERIETRDEDEQAKPVRSSVKGRPLPKAPLLPPPPPVPGMNDADTVIGNGFSTCKLAGKALKALLQSSKLEAESAASELDS